MIAIVKYNAGNISSVKTALERLGEDVIITDDPKILNAAERSFSQESVKPVLP